MYNGASVNLMILCGWKRLWSCFIHIHEQLLALGQRQREGSLNVKITLTDVIVCCMAVAEQDVFIGVAREGPATSLVWHRIYIIQYKCVVDYNVLDHLVPKTQLNTINFYLILI